MKIRNMWKRFLLSIKRILRSIFRGLGFKLSIIFLLFSFLVSLMIIAPICFNRIPVYSYFISELELPIAYELNGVVKIIDNNNNIVNKDIEVFIGGYSTTTNVNGEFKLKFSAPTTTEIFVTIRYVAPNGNTNIACEILTIGSGEHDLEKEFIIHV